MNFLKLIALGLLSVSPVFAATSYVCTQESGSAALLGVSFSVGVDDESFDISNDDIGICSVDEGDLYGPECSVEDEVSISLYEALENGEEQGYVHATSESEETLYACEADENRP